MERPASWKVVTLGAALTGLSVAGAGAAQADSGSPGSGPASVSPAPLFNERIAAVGKWWSRSRRLGHGGPGWGSPGRGWGWIPKFGGCISVTGPLGYVSGSACI